MKPFLTQLLIKGCIIIILVIISRILILFLGTDFLVDYLRAFFSTIKCLNFDTIALARGFFAFNIVCAFSLFIFFIGVIFSCLSIEKLKPSFSKQFNRKRFNYFSLIACIVVLASAILGRFERTELIKVYSILMYIFIRVPLAVSIIFLIGCLMSESCRKVCIFAINYIRMYIISRDPVLFCVGIVYNSFICFALYLFKNNVSKAEDLQLHSALSFFAIWSTSLMVWMGPFARAWCRVFSNDFIDEYYRKTLSKVISKFDKHRVLLGFGGLGRGVQVELLERMDEKDILKLKVPLLDPSDASSIKYLVKNMVIVDRDERLFDKVFADPAAEKIGIAKLEYKDIELSEESFVELKKPPCSKKFDSLEFKKKIRYDIKKEHLIFKGVMTKTEKEKLKNLFPNNNSYNKEYQQKIEKLFQKSHRLNTTENEVWIPAIIGDFIDESVIGNCALGRCEFFIDTMEGYEESMRISKFAHDNPKTRGIITVSDSAQQKFLFPRHSGQGVFLTYPTQQRGISLGEVVYPAIVRYLNDDKYYHCPNVLVFTDELRQTHYMIETILQELKMGGHLSRYLTGRYSPCTQEHVDLGITICSEAEEIKRVCHPKIPQSMFHKDLDERKWVEIIERCANPEYAWSGKKYYIESRVILEKPHLVTMEKIINKLEPKIAVISYKNTADILKILHDWIIAVERHNLPLSQRIENDGKINLPYRPKIIVGYQGEEERDVRDWLQYYDALCRDSDDKWQKYPMQAIDCMVDLNKDSKENIAAIAEAMYKNK